MKDQGKYTQLYSTIKKFLLHENHQSCQDIQAQIYTNPLYLNILGKDLPSFATDLSHSIQVEFANKNVEQQMGRFVRNPTNQHVTDYYFIKEKQWNAFNCSKRILERDHPTGQIFDTTTNPVPIHPYQPQYYFGKDFPDFCVQKSKGNTYFLSCKRIRIFKWRFRIVNMNKSGWYAPVLEAIDYKYDFQPVKEDFRGISCVIYENDVRLMMERLRLIDFREKKMHKMPYEQQEISMLYFLRNAKKTIARRVNIFKMDKQQTLLTYRRLPTLKYVLFGQAQGLLPLQEGVIQAPMYEDRIKLINMENLQVLFNKKQPPKPQERQSQLWSSSDEDQEEKEEAENKLPVAVAMVDESEESNEEEDPLRNLYLKEFSGFGIGK